MEEIVDLKLFEVNIYIFRRNIFCKSLTIIHEPWFLSTVQFTLCKLQNSSEKVELACIALSLGSC